MDSQVSAAVAPQQVSGQSAFWILVTLALAAITQPSVESRRKERHAFDGEIDLLRSFPGTCLLDGIVDIAVLGQAMRDGFRQRHAPLKANAVTVKLAIWMFAVLPQAIKVFSMRGIPFTQFCAACYFFAATTKLMIEFSRVETNWYFSRDEAGDMTTILRVISYLFILYGQMALEGLIWYQITRSSPVSLPQQVHDFREWIAFVLLLPLVLQLLVWIIRYPFRGSYSGPYAVPVFALLVLLGLSSIGRKAKSSETTDKTKAVSTLPPKWMDTSVEAINRGACVAIVSILVAKAIGVLGDLIARWGHLPSTAPPIPDLGLPGHSSLAIPGGMSDQLDSVEGASVGSHEACSPRFIRLLKSSMIWTLSLGSRIDRWLRRFLSIKVLDTTIIASTIFNLLTTIFYYLLLFDGTGTESPDWVSYLG